MTSEARKVVILRLLDKRPLGQTDIVEKTGYSVSRVQDYMRTLQHAKKVIKIHTLWFSLPPADKPLLIALLNTYNLLTRFMTTTYPNYPDLERARMLHKNFTKVVIQLQHRIEELEAEAEILIEEAKQ